MKPTNMDALRTWYGAEKLAHDWERVNRFWRGEGRCLGNITLGAHRPRQDTGDEARFTRQMASLEKQAAVPGLNVPATFGDYGTVSGAQYWGGAVRHAPENGNPHITPAATTLEAALKLTPRPVDDPELDAARLLRLFHRLREALGTDALRMRTLDPSGPLNTAGLILDQQELYMAMADDPAGTQVFLQRVCDFMIALWRHQIRACGERVCGAIWPYVVLPQAFGIVVTEDLMPLLSSDNYAEFGIPLLKRLDAEFGGLLIHCCGRYGHQVANLKAAGLRLRGIEFHHPYTTIEELAPLAGDTVFVPYLSGGQQDRFKNSLEFYRHLVNTTPAHYRYWFACLDNNPETHAFLGELGAL